MYLKSFYILVVKSFLLFSRLKKNGKEQGTNGKTERVGSVCFYQKLSDDVELKSHCVR
jgi:hypothetical protein